jgi:hypothetical protein
MAGIAEGKQWNGNVNQWNRILIQWNRIVNQIGLRVTEGHMKTAVVRLAIMGINPGIKFLIRATH